MMTRLTLFGSTPADSHAIDTDAECIDVRLLGRWRRVGGDGTADQPALVFHRDGTLHRLLRTRQADRIVRLDYRVSGSVIVCTHWASTHENRIAFALEPGGTLRLDGAGGTTWYRPDPSGAAARGDKPWGRGSATATAGRRTTAAAILRIAVTLTHPVTR